MKLGDAPEMSHTSTAQVRGDSGAVNGLVPHENAVLQTENQTLALCIHPTHQSSSAHVKEKGTLRGENFH